MENLSINCFENIQQIIHDEDFKDFTLIIQGQSFRAHKLVLAARSKVFAELFRSDKELKHFQVNDISPRIFKTLLDFIYNDQIPPKDVSLIDVYAAAENFQIDALKVLASKELEHQINDKNVFEIFVMSSEFKNDDLKHEAFQKIQSMFPYEKIQKNDMKKIHSLFESKPPEANVGWINVSNVNASQSKPPSYYSIDNNSKSKLTFLIILIIF